MSVRPSPAPEQVPYSPRTPTVLLPRLPPPPPRDGQPTSSPVRPGHAPIPPQLNINAAAPRGLLTQGPLSATSLHGPFSPSFISSPVTVSTPRSALPMATRVAGNYNVPYDPREWVARGSRRSSLVLEGRNVGAEAEEGISNPPPPYSASATRESTACASAGSTISPADSTFTGGNPSQINTPTSTVGVLSPFNQQSSSAGDAGQSIGGANGTQYFNPPPSRISHLSVGSQPHESRPNSALSVTRSSYPLALSINTATAQQNIVPPPLVENAPAARRAASVGAASSHGSSYDGSVSRSSSRQRSWQPGMPLPGPPPGPPPSASRSQSASGVQTNAAGPSSRPNSYRVPLHAPLLSPLPPTPANWKDEPASRSNSRAPMPLHIETTNLDRPGSGLSRSAALRVSSAKGLLERRKQRRSMHEGLNAEMSGLTIDTDSWFDAMSPAGLSSEHSPTLDAALQERSSTEVPRKVVRAASRSRRRFQRSDDDNVPFNSPYPSDALGLGARPQLHPLKTLPTPPLSQKNPMSAHSARLSAPSSVSEMGQGDYDDFMTEASRRHQAFLLRESQAGTDLERLQLFMDFVVEESKIRQQRYPAPFLDGQFIPEEARQRLFAAETDAGRLSTPAVALDQGQTTAPHVARIDPPQRQEGSWWKDYQPELSPIASMSNDEHSSRGRTASRWWHSETGSDADGANKKAKRSKREAKYMGVPALSMQEILSEAATPTNLNEVYSSAEVYANEKANPDDFGVYQDGEPVPVQDPSPPNPLSPAGLDISRFITLPPPYPRHYPAVNNSHPKLSTYRNLVRTLGDLGDLENRRSRHLVSVEALRTEHKKKTTEQQKIFRVNMQEQINEGSISYAEAAEAEQALRLEERQAEKECLQAEFDTLQDVVINPMHDLLNDRLVQLNSHISGLTETLVAETQAGNVDRPQQEGDAVPEILEYLTQLKWLFETRETVHKEILELLSERNEKYKAIVLLPYHQVGNMDKIRDTEDFFARDSVQRSKTFYDEAVVRYQNFVQLVADKVGEEVDLQSSAFWDIAPSLMELVQKLPDEIDDMGPIAIPEAEYVENPIYHEYPQQYLYTLLDHAEKSTYQFIEAQINLQCLLHEVKLSLLGAKCRAAGIGQPREAVDGTASRDDDPKRLREEQEAAATAELKQHVAMIEEQWLEALGSALQGKKARVKSFLEVVGGWDESMSMVG